MGVAELLIVVLGGAFVLNWLGVLAATAALGLRRRRWGTPGGGWAVASAGCALAGAVAAGAIVAVVEVLDARGVDIAELVLPPVLAAALAGVVGSHVCLVRAAACGLRAADGGEKKT